MSVLYRLLAAALLFTAWVGAADAKNKLTFAYVTDPSHEIYFYAIRNGIVKSDKIELELVTTSIPALGQAMLGRQYDIIETSSIIIPAAVTQGLEVKILNSAIGRQTPGPTMSLWVNKDSPLTSAEQLKGKRVATYGLGSTGTTMVRIALNKKHGFNVALRGGDVQFIEMPTAAIPAAIKSGSIDAGYLLYAQVDQAERTGEFRPVFLGGPVLNELAGVRMVLPVIIGFSERVQAAPADYAEFNRMVVASLKYASEHPEMIAKVAADSQMADSVGFLKAMFDGIYPYKAPVEADDIKAINFVWNAAKEIGMLQNVPQIPDAATLMWPEALKPVN